MANEELTGDNLKIAKWDYLVGHSQDRGTLIQIAAIDELFQDIEDDPLLKAKKLDMWIKKFAHDRITRMQVELLDLLFKNNGNLRLGLGILGNQYPEG